MAEFRTSRTKESRTQRGAQIPGLCGERWHQTDRLLRRTTNEGPKDRLILASCAHSLSLDWSSPSSNSVLTMTSSRDISLQRRSKAASLYRSKHKKPALFVIDNFTTLAKRTFPLSICWWRMPIKRPPRAISSPLCRQCGLGISRGALMFLKLSPSFSLSSYRRSDAIEISSLSSPVERNGRFPWRDDGVRGISLRGTCHVHIYLRLNGPDKQKMFLNQADEKIHQARLYLIEFIIGNATQQEVSAKEVVLHVEIRVAIIQARQERPFTTFRLSPTVFPSSSSSESIG